MRIEHDRSVCEGRFQCVQLWDGAEKNLSEFRAELPGAKLTSSEVVEQTVDESEAENAKEAARACPTNALTVYEDGEQIIP